MEELTIRKLAEYCRDYVDLVSPSAYARSDKRVNLPVDIFSSEPLLSNASDINYDDQLVFPINLSIDVFDLAYDNDETVHDVSSRSGATLEIARKLDDIQRTYKTNSYTKQLSLQFGKISFQGIPNFYDDDTHEEDGRKNMEGYLLSVPISLSHQDSNGHRNYEVRIEDTFVKTNVGFLRNFLKLEYRDDLYNFVAKNSNEENTEIPVRSTYVDELWSKIITYLKFSGAIEVSSVPDMSDVAIVLEPKANYFLSQDLSGIIQTADDKDLAETSLSTWIDKDERNVYDSIDDKGEHELFFPFAYDKYQLHVLSRIHNKGLIVEGPPGTGKSQTISNLLVHLTALGKKVLFVSQKDQAVRGVKDKLKSLSIPFLFGYIPDRSSRLHTEQDERDSVAYSLRGIAHAHLAKVAEQDPKKHLAEIKDSVKSFNQQIDEIRGFVPTFEEWKSLEEYDFNEDTNRISKEWYNEILAKREMIDSMREELSDLMIEEESVIQNLVHKKNELCNVLEETEETRQHFRKSVDYSWLQKEQEYLRELGYGDLAEITHNVIDLFQKTATDRRGKKVPTFFNRWKLSKRIDVISHRLPLELYEAYKAIIFSDATKTERRIALDKIEAYFGALARFQGVHLRTLEDLRQLELKKEKTEGDREVIERALGKENTALNSLMLDDTSMARFEALYQKNDVSLFEKIQRRSILGHRVRNQISFNPNEVRQGIMREKLGYEEQVKNYVANRIINRSIAVRGKKEYRAALESIARKLSKTKKAYRTFDNLKSNPFNFEAMSSVTPIWMMSLEDASRILPLQSNLFDYVIIDEASQCNIAYTLPVMYRARHAVFFGDTLQMRDATISFKSNSQLQSLAYKHSIPEEMQIKAEGDSVKSVMDIAKLNGFETIALKRHYRSPLEIIGFSNEHFYSPKNRRLEVVNDEILATDDGHIMKIHVLRANQNLEDSARVNKTEAYFIKELIDKIKTDERTREKSIAVLSFFNDQAELLRNAIPYEDVKVSTIEGIQGDERDVVIFSFVISNPKEKKRYIALTGESGEINKEINEGRVNVAFSRARLQVHAVTSLATHLWPEGIWIKKYLQYIEEHGRVKRLSKAEQHFDSHFEEEVYDFLMQNLDLRDYRVSTQVESCGFKIDQVITNIKSGKKLAIECDGPTHFEDGNGQVRVTNDFERQYVLEMARWVFHRISYVEWQQNRKATQKTLIETIDCHFKGNGQNQIPDKPQKPEMVQHEALTVEIPESFLRRIEPMYGSDDGLRQYARRATPHRHALKGEREQSGFFALASSPHHEHNLPPKTTSLDPTHHDEERKADVREPDGKPTKERTSRGNRIVESNQITILDLLDELHDTRDDDLQQGEKDVAQHIKTPKGEMNDFFNLSGSERVDVEDIVSIIQRLQIPFIDNRDKGGALWIIGGNELEGFVKECKAEKIVFQFKAGGGRVTKGKDAWWTK